VRRDWRGIMPETVLDTGAWLIALAAILLARRGLSA
jgi:hypothetical protein